VYVPSKRECARAHVQKGEKEKQRVHAKEGTNRNAQG